MAAATSVGEIGVDNGRDARAPLERGRIEVVVNGVSHAYSGGMFHPNVFCVLWKVLKRSNYVARIGMTEIEFGCTDAKVRGRRTDARGGRRGRSGRR